MTPSSPPDAGLSSSGFQDANAYDQVMGCWSRRLAPLLIGFGGLADGKRVLDVGCGTGSLTFALQTFANLAGVTGIDATEPFIAAARSRNTDPRIAFDLGTRGRCHMRTRPSTVPTRLWSCTSSPTRQRPWRRCAASCGPAEPGRPNRPPGASPDRSEEAEELRQLREEVAALRRTVEARDGELLVLRSHVAELQQQRAPRRAPKPMPAHSARRRMKQ
jgi:hypothetical protein